MKAALEQQMVANVDICLIVSSLNKNFSLNRMLRYVAVVRQGNVTPVVVLTKADLCSEVEEYIRQVKETISDIDVLAVSAKTGEGEGLKAFEKYCIPGATIAFLGSSGVGKSTLINALFGEEILATGEIRETDAKGRHTTTTRQRLTTKDGITFIDTPGVRDKGSNRRGKFIKRTICSVPEDAAGE